MCTVTWLRMRDGYQLLCSRDERRTRLPALPPLIREQHGVRFIAPIDGQFGGTWAAVNEFGISFCLLNGQADALTPSTSGFSSRGRLILELVDSPSISEARSRMAGIITDRYQPFRLLALKSEEPAVLFEWNGIQTRFGTNPDDCLPLTSSSFDADAVVIHRKRLLASLVAYRGGIDLELLREFHGSHVPFPSAYSPCMHRSDASTVSFSQVEVRGRHIGFTYQPGPPCLSRPGHVYVTSLRQKTSTAERSESDATCRAGGLGWHL